jgi:hypothetical protein
VGLRFASQSIEAPRASACRGEIEEYEAEQHRRLAAIGERIEALRGVSDEIGKAELAGEYERGDPGKQAEEKERAADKSITPANQISENGAGVGIAAGKPKNFEKAC